MKNYLIYNFSGELDDIAHLFPNDRLAQIAALIKDSGNNIEIWDRGNIDELITWGKEHIQQLGDLAFYEYKNSYLDKLKSEADKIILNNFDTIFLNLWQGSGFKFSMDLAKVLKSRKSSIKIYGIGQKVDWFREHILELFPFLDGLMLGLELISIESIIAEKNIKSIPNMILKKDNDIIFTKRLAVDVNNYPLPLYSNEHYIGLEGKIPLFMISLSNQACLGKCSFCVRPVNYGRKIIKKNMQEVIKEVIHLMKNYKTRCFRICDSTPPPFSLTEFAKKIIDTGLHKENIIISGFARIDVNQNEDFDLLKKAGIGALFFGIESLDDNNLKKLKKGINFKKIKRTLKKVHEAGIYTIGSFIFPIPDETKETRKITLQHLYEVKDDLDSILIRPAGIYPMSDWGLNPGKYNIKLDSDYIERFLIYPIKQLLPVRLLPEFPFTYALMGKKAEDVSFEEIINLCEDFIKVVRKDIGIPGIPDYYWTLAQYLKEDVTHFTERIINYMVNREYRKIKNIMKKFIH